MLQLGFQKHIKSPWKFIISSLTSCLFVLLSQFALALIPRYFASFSLLAQLSLSALLLLIITGVGNNCRRLIGFYASAPAFVFFNIVFIWGTHATLIRKGVSVLWSIVFNVECVLLILGFYSIVSSDPGLVAHGDTSLEEIIQNEGSGVKSYTEDSLPVRRIRNCKHCKAYIKGFDHHCPAFGNCIGEKNHRLFMALLVGFVMVETSYVVCSTQYITKSLNLDKAMLEFNLSGYLAISTRLFSILQVLWQVLFLTWHIYCVCVNIRTDEWVNWNKYPEFQDLVHFVPGQSNLDSRYRNPYDRGIFSNIKEFLSPKG